MPKHKPLDQGGAWHRAPCYHAVVDHHSRKIPDNLEVIRASKLIIDQPNVTAGQIKHHQTMRIAPALQRIQSSFNFIASELKKNGHDQQWKQFPGLENVVRTDWDNIFNNDRYLAPGQALPRFPLLDPPPSAPQPQQPGTKRKSQSPVSSSRQAKKTKTTVALSEQLAVTSQPDTSDNEQPRSVPRHQGEQPHTGDGKESRGVPQRREEQVVASQPGTSDDEPILRHSERRRKRQSGPPRDTSEAERTAAVPPSDSGERELPHSHLHPNKTPVRLMHEVGTAHPSHDRNTEDEIIPETDYEDGNDVPSLVNEQRSASNGHDLQDLGLDDETMVSLSDSMASMVELTTRLMADMRTEYRKAKWFEGWTLAPAFTRGYWKRCLKNIVNKGFSPLPLIMCDSEAQNLKSVTLAEALARLPPGRKKFARLRQKMSQIKHWIHHSHRCHNPHCRLLPHITSEQGFLNYLRELCRDVEKWLRKGEFPMFCKEHAKYGPCLVGCMALTRVEKVVGQWMAANDVVDLKDVPGWKLGDMASLGDEVLGTRLYSYLVKTAGDVFLCPISEHNLKTLCSHAVHDPDTELTAADESVQIQKLLFEVQRKQEDPGTFDDTQSQQLHEEVIRLQRFSIEQLEHRHKAVLRHNRNVVSWKRADAGGMYCRLCFTRYHEMSPEKWPVHSRVDTFPRSVLPYLKHLCSHTDFDEAVRCEELEAMMNESELLDHTLLVKGGPAAYTRFKDMLARRDLPTIDFLMDSFATDFRPERAQRSG